jgi:hypothetical protein
LLHGKTIAYAGQFEKKVRAVLVQEVLSPSKKSICWSISRNPLITTGSPQTFFLA